MYKSFDGKSFDTVEELHAYEYKKLKRVKLKISLVNFVGYYVESQLELDRAITAEIDQDYQTFISCIKFPSWIVTFTDDEAREFHVVEMDRATNYIYKHVSKVFKQTGG